MLRAILTASFLLAAAAGAPAAPIVWQPALDAALAQAKAENKVIFIAVNMDHERANDRMVNDVYKDATIQGLAAKTLNLFCSRFDHGSGDKPCPRAGSVTCAEHMALEKIVRAAYLKTGADGGIVAPEHVFVGPDGKVILSVAYEVSKGELEWCFAAALKHADPGFKHTASGAARAPRRLVMEGVADPGDATTRPAPTKEEVDEILDRLKKGEKPWQMRDEIARLLQSDDKRAKDYLNNLLTSKMVNRDNWIGTLLHSIGRLSPASYWELVAPFLEDDRPDVRREAIVALEQLREPKAAAALGKAWKREKEVEDRAELLRALAATGPADKKTVALVTETADKGKDVRLRAAALIAAAAFTEDAAALLLAERYVTSEEPALRAAAACLFALRHAESGKQPLDAAALVEKDPATKQALEDALRVLRGEDVRKLDPVLRRVTGSEIERDRN